MKNIGIAVILLAMAVLAADKFQPLNIKTGLWEATTTVTMAGQSSLPDELLSKLTPEQRARYESRLKANSGDKARTFTRKNCLTEEKLQRGSIFKQDQQNCTEKVLNSTSNNLQLQVACQGEGVKSEGTISIEALGAETLKGAGGMAVTSGAQTRTSKTSFTAKWLGPSCGEIK
jgi:hypothetical protein